MACEGQSVESMGRSKFMAELHKPGIDQQTVIDLYDQYANIYDQEVTSDVVRYTGPRLVAEITAEILRERKDASILDAGAGTGLVGEHLREMGFTRVDALDASKSMLEVAREKNIYRRLIHATLGPRRLDIKDDTYDVLVAAGVFLEGHAKSDCFPELIRTVKPGGWVIFTMKESNRVFHEPEMSRLEEDGKWICVEKKIIPDYCKNGVGIIFKLQLTR